MNKKTSGYRLLWMQVIFDLPVIEPKQRKDATDFRNRLLDLGFSMVQFSVYMRHIKDKEQSETFLKNISISVPHKGSVQVLVFTDKQYEQIKTFESGVKSKNKSPEQLCLF